MHSRVYEGTVQHRRHAPRGHAFRYRVFMLYLDLAELETVFARRWFWSTRRPAPVWFRRADHFGDPDRPLDACVRDLVAAETGTRPTGAIRLLTHPRYYGYVQNPVSFYYCFAADGSGVETIVAEITNTPWSERHTYVIPVRGTTDPEHHARFEKAFHVSPFMPMEQTYDWRFSPPGERLTVRMQNLAQGARVFDATLTLEQRPLSGPVLAGALLRFPWMTAQVVFGIYWQAFRLWLKGTPFHSHPHTRRTNGSPLVTR